MRARFILLAVLCVQFLGLDADAQNNGVLRVVAEDGLSMALDRTTVLETRIEPTTIGYTQATPDNPVYQVHFFLNKSAQREFGRLTELNTGRRIRFVLDGREIAAPILRTSILGGHGIVPTQSADDAKAMVEAMRRMPL